MSDGITASRAEVMETVYELACLLNTGLDRDTLAILMALIQKGVNPEALAAVVKDLRIVAADSNGSCQERTYTGGKQPLSTQELQKKRRSDY
ncbi:putative mitotic-spindle organizing protein [Plasmopara halstedii]